MPIALVLLLACFALAAPAAVLLGRIPADRPRPRWLVGWFAVTAVGGWTALLYLAARHLAVP